MGYGLVVRAIIITCAGLPYCIAAIIDDVSDGVSELLPRVRGYGLVVCALR